MSGLTKKTNTAMIADTWNVDVMMIAVMKMIMMQMIMKSALITRLEA
jgi:hypothetical protein